MQNENGLMMPRIGQGYDVHAFEDGDDVTLCGTQIPSQKKLKGHSDADVAWHALTDALLGAIAEGDIGVHFPPSDDQWRGAPSSVFLTKARDLVSGKGYVVSNVDITLICEMPKISPHGFTMRTKTAELLEIQLDQVSVKATTTEKLGFEGRKEGIACQAVVMLVPRLSPNT
jgi:2-C-methyl-D-erythritol 4-phosphate cytidylyltransferase/2-C-methyl-D-erythritol 2,4-cyclodiphosphate synthase